MHGIYHVQRVPSKSNAWHERAWVVALSVLCGTEPVSVCLLAPSPCKALRNPDSKDFKQDSALCMFVPDHMDIMEGKVESVSISSMLE